MALSLLLASILGISAHAQSKADEEALQQLPQAFCDAWAKHDGHELAKIMAEDVDFVTVGGTWFRGRADFEAYHTKLLKGRFRESKNSLIETVVRFVRPDLALVHWNWSIEGDTNPDGSVRPKRFGIMTMVAEKRNDRWLVIAAQNTNAGAGAPEAEGIKSPIALPKATQP